MILSWKSKLRRFHILNREPCVLYIILRRSLDSNTVGVSWDQKRQEAFLKMLTCLARPRLRVSVRHLSCHRCMRGSFPRYLPVSPPTESLSWSGGRDSPGRRTWSWSCNRQTRVTSWAWSTRTYTCRMTMSGGPEGREGGREAGRERKESKTTCEQSIVVVVCLTEEFKENNTGERFNNMMGSWLTDGIQRSFKDARWKQTAPSNNSTF